MDTATQHRVSRTLSFSLVALLIAIVAIGSFPSAFAASAALDVTLRTDFPVVNSGDWAVVEVNYSCSSITSVPCTDVVISSVLPPELAGAASDVQVLGIGATTSYDPATRTARWAFNTPISAGSAGTFELRVRFAPGSTPDGTEALLRAEITGSNAAPDVSNQLALTARATPRAQADKRLLEGGVLDLPTVYQVEVCVPNPGSGAVDLTNVVLTDRLPPGATFVSASDGGVYDPGTGTVTWPATNILVSAGQSCVRRTVTVTFTEAVFNIGDEVRNDLDVTATALGGATLTLTDADVRLIQPPTPGYSFRKSGPEQAKEGDTVRYNFTQRNTGTTALSDLSLVDEIPAELRVTRVYAAAHNQSATLRLLIEYQTDQNATWQTLPGAPFTGAACVNVAPTTGGGCGSTLTLAAGEYITALRWTYLDPIPYGWQTTGNGNGFSATVDSVPANQIIVNTGESRYTFNGYSVITPSTVRTRVVLDTPAARPSLGKTVDPDVVYSGGVLTYTLTLRNEQLAGLTTDLVSPQVVDLLETSLLYEEGSQTVESAPVGAPAPQFQLTPDYQGSGRQLLSWSWPGYSLAPGEELVVSFRARVAPFTTAGRIDNSAYLAGWDNQPSDILINGCPGAVADSYDFDGDGNTQELLCRSTISSINLAEAARSDSLKLVKGQLDSTWTKDPDTGLTVPGGQLSYTLTITNTGTIPIHELVLVDILPWIGDTGVIRIDQERETEWRPFLLEPIVGPPGSTIYYSTQTNPCRQPDLGLNPDSPGCEPPAWSTEPPADLTSVQAFKIDFGSLVLAPEDAVTVGLRMRAPYDGEDGDIAWNSFAYRARELGTNDYLLAAEPPRVGIERAQTVPPGYGNFVWLDLNNNGLQDDGEPGVNGARIELYRDSDGTPGPSAGDTLVDWTLSGPHDDGRPGFYLFSHPDLLPPGDYYARVTPPPGYALVTPHVGGDDTIDSDVDPATGFMPVTTLDPGELDLTWDVGLRATTAVGNYVWLDQNRNGVQDEPPGAGINGVTVRLRRAADDSLVATTVTADDMMGRPGFYLFDELDAGDYYLEFELPAGLSFTTRDQGDDAADSDVDPATGRTAVFSLVDGQYDPTRDAGLTLPAGNQRLGDRVWLDSDNDGRYEPEAGEQGINGVRLNLYLDVNGNNQPDPGEYVGSTVTASRLGESGWYQFEGLPPGDYIVALDPSNFVPGGPLYGLQSSTGNEPTPDPDDDRDHDDNGDLVGGMIVSKAITLNGNEPTTDGDDANGNQTLDFGLVASALGDRVWFDTNGNGVQDVDELGVPGIVVELLDESGTVLQTTVTDQYGSYGFGNLPAGNYRVRFSGLPAGYGFTTRDAGGDDARDSDVDPATGTTDLIALPPGGLITTVDAGLIAPLASIGDRVWDDLDRDGVQDPGELGIDGVTVQLFRADGTLVDTTVTGGGGLYSFNGLPPGDYYVQFGPPPAGYTVSPQNIGTDDTLDSDADVVTLRTAVVTLGPGVNDTSWDLGLYTYASIGDRVWNDLDRDGLQDDGEGGVGGVTVRLYRPGSSTPIASTVTNSTGHYSFTNLIPGDYYLEFSLPSGYRASPQNVGADDTVDSDADPSTFQTPVTTLDPGENDTSWDFGIFRTASIGDRAWLDLNANGIQDLGEPGVPGVQVVLYDSSGQSVNSTVTNASGNYSFTNLVPGDYSLLFVPPPNYILSPRDIGADDTRDSDAFPAPGRTALITLDPGENDTSWDIGLYQLASLGDLVWHDLDADGVQDGGEPGIPGVEVHLYTPGLDGLPGTADDVLVDTQYTGGDGRYRFDDLVPGNYFVQFTMPAGYDRVSPHDSAAADDDTDSDVDPVTLRTPVVNLPSSTTNLSLDMGVYNLASLGDRVWFDADADGVQDVDETSNPGDVLTGIIVELWRPGDATPASTTVTDATGYYSFTDLIPGDYYLVFHPPTGYTFTPQDQGADDADSDVSPLTGRTGIIRLESGENDDTWDAGIFLAATVGDRVWLDMNANGVQDADETEGVPGVRVELLRDGNVVDYAYTDLDGRYLFTNLPPGNYQVRFSQIPSGYVVSPRDVGADDEADSDADTASGLVTPIFALATGDDDRSHDLGLYQPASLGDYVWHDLDADGVQEAGEPGIGGVTVQLYNSAGDLIGTTVTNGAGYYSFTGLVPGDYYVQFTMPAGYDLVSPRDVAAAGDDLDSDADPATLRTVVTTLVSGENDLSWDLGVYRYASLGDLVWDDQDGDGIQDVGEPGIGGVSVTLDYAGPDGIFGTADDILAFRTTVTAGDGSYSFTQLEPGGYRISFGDLPGYARSPANNAASDALDSDADPTTGQTAVIILPSGEDDMTWDAGLFKLLSLGNLVWHDQNNDGQYDPATELGIGGVRVELYLENGTPGFDGTETLVAFTTTDTDGLYQFTDLLPGDYLVVIPASEFAAGGPLEGYISSTGTNGAATGLFEPAPDPNTDIDGDDNGTAGAGYVASATVNLSLSGEPDVAVDGDDTSGNQTVDFGFFQPLSLGDLVWDDLNNDGVFDPATELGIGGVRVELYLEDGTPGFDGTETLVAFTTTDASGRYLFTNLHQGDYLVVIPASQFAAGAPLEGYVSSTGASGAATGPYEPAPDPDTNVADERDNGSALNGNVVTSAITLRYGEEPDTAVDGDGTASNRTVDFGLFRPASLGDLVWLDQDRDGLQGASEPGVPGVTVTLLRPGPDGLPGTADDEVVATTVTGVGGSYLFEGLGAGEYFLHFDLPQGYERTVAGGGAADDSDADQVTGNTPVITLAPGDNDLDWDAGLIYTASLGDRVWLDQNANGVQDPGEPGVSGVIVTLYTSTGTFVDTTTTDAGGFYGFSHLPPDDYKVVFTLPAGYQFSPVGRGGDPEADSDADPVTGETTVISIALGDADASWDAGIFELVRLGDLVWEDENNNGVRDGSEQGIAGVAVRLFADEDGDGVPDSQTPVATTVTDQDGSYGFDGLVPGRYIVEIDPPAGYVSSTGTNGSATGPFEPAPSPEDDRDDDDNGGKVGAVVRSGTVLLLSQGEPDVAVDGDDTNGNQTVDFGLFRPAALGSAVWYDRDGDGRSDGEDGVPGVIVSLYYGDGTPVLDSAGRPITTVTDSDGKYLFDNLIPGSYIVGFSGLPSGYTFTTPGVGDPDGDSDADTLTGRTPPVTLGAGDRDMSLWAGLINPTAISLISFTAERQGDGVVLRWATGAEWSSWGFHILRSADGTRASAVRVTPEMIWARGGPQRGETYEWPDASAEPGVAYTYWLQEVDRSRVIHEYGPAAPSAKLSADRTSVFLPIVVR